MDELFAEKCMESNITSITGYCKALLLSFSEGFCFYHHLFAGPGGMLLKIT